MTQHLLPSVTHIPYLHHEAPQALGVTVQWSWVWHSASRDWIRKAWSTIRTAAMMRRQPLTETNHRWEGDKKIHWESQWIAKMSPKCCRLLHDNVCCGIWMYFFFKTWVSDLCLSQTWRGTVVLHLAACKNGGRILLEGSSFTGLPSGSSWARDKPPPVTWLPATVGTLCRQNAKWGASVFSMLSMLTHIRSLHADW